MESLIISFFSGFLVSLSGSIYPSNMSATAMEITMDKSKKAGIWFGAGASIVEIIYIRLYFLGFDSYLKSNDLFLVMQWIMVIFFFSLGILLFYRTYEGQFTGIKKRKDFSNYNAVKAFAFGTILKALNPMQFVFWAFWSTYLIANNWLKPKSSHYDLFCLGLGLATFSGFILYVFLGNYLISKSLFNRKISKRVIAVFLSLTSLAWAIKLLIKPEGLLL